MKNEKENIEKIKDIALLNVDIVLSCFQDSYFEQEEVYPGHYRIVCDNPEKAIAFLRNRFESLINILCSEETEEE